MTATQHSMRSICHQLETSGFADLGVTDSSVPTLRLAETVAVTIGATVAAPIDRLNATAIGVKPANTYGGNYGCAELPLHTDLAHWHRPPRFVLLRCIVGSPEVSTRLLDRYDLERWIMPTLMRRALFAPRRRLDGRMYLLRMMTHEMVRWDGLFLTPKNAQAREIANLMSELAPAMPVRDIRLSEPGSAVLLDNWRVLHGRSAVPTSASGRLVDRVYLDLIEHGNEDTS